MRKQIVAVLVLLVFGAILTGAALAQQSPPSTQSSPSAPPQKPSAKSAPASAAKKPTPAAPALTTDRDKESYALGMDIAKGLKAQSIDVDTALMLRGLKDSLSGGKTLLTEDEEKDALTKLQSEVRQKQEEERKELAEKNLKDGQAFLAANKTKEGVIVLPSGLQYKILTEGTGRKPTATDTVICQYRGTLIDGTEFDSSYKRGQPATFPLGRVIKGWTEALQLMPVGSKWQLVIPPDLAYGERGYPGTPIGPNAALVFEIELLSIRPPVQSAVPGVAPNSNPSPSTNPSATPPPTPQK